jgi:hypothetical protein
MRESDKIISALANLSRELAKEYGELDPVVEIRLKRKTFNYLMMDIVQLNRSYMTFSPADLAEPSILGITVLPEKIGR